jgi:hypothetical protein
MTKKKAWMAMALVAALGVAGCGDDDGIDQPPADQQPAAEQAQPGAPGAQQEMDPEMMALMTEAQEIQQRLAPIQEEAMQDEELSNQLEALRDRIETAMREEAPELFERMDEFEDEFMAAQEAGDQERAQEIGMEAQGVEMELQSIQQTVLARPEIDQAIEDFESAQRERMLEIDEEAAELMDRMDEIQAEMEGL